MCKIIAFTDTKKLNLKKHLNNIGNQLLKLEADGFGYAIQSKTGVFGEKTIARSFRSRMNATNQVILPIVKRQYAKFGNPGELSGPGIFHGRTSTNKLGLKNTHPMQRPDDDGFWHLIHNGVVNNYGERYNKLTDNDSEDLLFHLMNGIDQVEKHLSGYYAFAAIDPHGRLHVARDQWASLFIAWSPVYETHIIATTSTLILKLNKMLEAKIGPIDEIEDNIYLIFNGNELIHQQDIKPRGYSHAESKHAERSLGYSISQLPKSEVVVNGNIQVSEASWQQDKWDEAIALLDSEGKRDDNHISNAETAYYNLKRELDNMDAAYTIQDQDDNFIKVHEFRKLDWISQELCTIIRPDGTVVDMSGEEYLRRA
jgi:hypothetical protein